MLHQRNNSAAYQVNDEIEPNAEDLWDNLTDWGWAGPAFERAMDTMLANLTDVYHTKFHQGLETLGQCYGATPTRTTEHGAPDVVWSFSNDLYVAFEAKTEKKVSSELSKKDVLEAKGHIDWTKERLCSDRDRPEIKVVVVAPEASLHEVAKPFAGGLYHVPPENVLKLAKNIADSVRKLRVTFAGREFAAAAAEFSAAMQGYGLDIPTLRRVLLSSTLK